MVKSKINTWLGHIWQMNKDESDLILNEIRQHLFRVRDEAKRSYDLIKEDSNEENE